MVKDLKEITRGRPVKKMLPKGTYGRICTKCKAGINSAEEMASHKCGVRSMNVPQDKKQIAKSNNESNLSPNQELTEWRRKAKALGMPHTHILTLDQCKQIVKESKDEQKTEPVKPVVVDDTVKEEPSPTVETIEDKDEGFPTVEWSKDDIKDYGAKHDIKLDKKFKEEKMIAQLKKALNK